MNELITPTKTALRALKPLQRKFEGHLFLPDRDLIPTVVAALVDRLTQVRTLIAAGVVEKTPNKPRTSQ